MAYMLLVALEGVNQALLDQRHAGRLIAVIPRELDAVEITHADPYNTEQYVKRYTGGKFQFRELYFENKGE